MPAKSQAQQRYFGFLKAHPEEARRRGIKTQVVDEFAATKRKGLPEKLAQLMGHKKKKRKRS